MNVEIGYTVINTSNFSLQVTLKLGQGYFKWMTIEESKTYLNGLLVFFQKVDSYGQFWRVYGVAQKCKSGWNNGYYFTFRFL